MKLLELQLRNIFSYGNNITKIPLNFDTPTLIIGENHDATVNGEVDSNGSGKSAILNSLVYAFYGKTLDSGIKLDELINNVNKKNLYSAVTFQANDGMFYTIERWRKNKALGGTGNNGVKITWGETIDSIINQKSPAIAIDKYIAEHILGMDFDIFVRIVTISGSLQSFLDLPTTSVNTTSQVSIVEEIFGQTILTEKGAILKDKVKETKATIQYLDELNERIKGETKRYQEQLDLAKKSIKDWDKERKFKIAEITDEISELEVIDFDNELEIINKRLAVADIISNAEHELSDITNRLKLHDNNVTARDDWELEVKRKLASTKKLLGPYKGVNFDDELKNLTTILDKEKSIAEQTKLKVTVNSEMDSIVESIDKIEVELAVLRESKCPYCSQEYTDNKDKISTNETTLDALRDSYEKKVEILLDIKDTCTTLELDISKIECMFGDLREFDSSKNTHDNLVKALSDIESETFPYTNMIISDKELGEYKSRQSELDDLIAEANAALVIIGESKYTLDTIYRNQANLKSLRANLEEKTNEVNPHIAAVERLGKVFANIDELQVDEADRLRVYLRHQEFMIKLLTRKDSHVRQALLDINLPVLNKQIRYYLDAIGLFHNVVFTKDMSVSISTFGNDIGFSNLSTGQKARINLAMAFAFRDVVQARHQKINFCILDECLDKGLGNLGVKLAAKMIKNVAADNELSMYVITHRDEIKASFDKTLKTILNGGITTVQFS